MALNSLQGDWYFNGTLSAKTTAPSAGSIVDASVATFAAIQASKLQHQHELPYSQANGVNVATETRAVHTVYGATATVVQFAAGIVTPITGNDTVTVDLKKNGSTILTSVITLSVAAAQNTARTLYTPAGFTSTALVAGDWLEVVVTATHNTGTLPQGLYARLVVTEAAQ